MTHPLDIQTDGTRSRALIPRLVFLLAIAILSLICANLHAHSWQYVVSLAAILLVRKTTEWEFL